MRIKYDRWRLNKALLVGMTALFTYEHIMKYLGDFYMGLFCAIILSVIVYKL